MNNLVEKVINGKTYLVDNNGKILYEKIEEPKEDIDEFTLTLDIKTDKLVTFDCFLSDNIGGSGISIKKSNKKDFIDALASYIESYFS
jgi:hypothetical protein